MGNISDECGLTAVRNMNLGESKKDWDTEKVYRREEF